MNKIRALALVVLVALLALPGLALAQGGAGTVNVRQFQFTQGSTTAGQTGGLILGAVTTGAPTYTTAQSSPLSLDTAGNLRTNCITGCAAPTPNTAFGNFQTTVTTSAAALATNTSKKYCSKSIAANTAVVYLGITGVTTATGYELNPGDVLCMTLSNTNIVFAIAASGSQTLTTAFEN